MDPVIILQAGVASGTVLLFAALGEILAERSGVLNLGVEGMMLIGAMSAFSTTIATGNPWLRERCGEYTGPRRNERTKQIKQRLETIKASRSADKLKWEDYFENGVLAAVSAEMNRFTYTGHGNAAFSWLEQIWPGNDAVKVKFIQTLRQTQAKSAFARDIQGLASDYR